MKVYIIENNKYEVIKNEYIPSNLIERIDKYKNKDDYINSYVAWYYLYIILKEEYNIFLDQIIIMEDDNHKPFIDKIYFNISHSNNVIAICISYDNCSIDIEYVDKFKELSLLKKKIYDDRYNVVSNDEVIKLWTKYEAAFKYDGNKILIRKLESINILNNIETFTYIDKNINKYYISVKGNKIKDIKLYE